MAKYVIPHPVLETRDPSTSDDVDAGRVKGQLWVNQSSSPLKTFICLDDTTGSAQWFPIILVNELIGRNSSGQYDFKQNLTVSANLLVTGDLQVEGSQTVLNSTDLEIEDNEIILNSDNNALAVGGLRIKRGGGLPDAIGYFDEATDQWMFGVDGSVYSVDQSNMDSRYDGRYLRRDQSTTPTVNESFDLGSTSAKWNNVYATNFIGTALEAKYADLAEKYTINDENAIPGTVISVSLEDEYEGEVCNVDCCDKVIGVISTKPGMILNSDYPGRDICIKGRTPVRIIGIIEKGDIIVSAGNGCARVIATSSEKIDRIGIALESSDDLDEKLVECTIL